MLMPTAGAVMFINNNAEQANATLTNAISLMRKNYSMSPFHGGGIVGTILSDAELTADWKAEVVEICDYVNGVRREFADLLNSKQDKKDFNFK